jgi:RNA polymerase sigma-70 factor (ECF subfamily)
MPQNANEAISELFESYGDVVYSLGLRMCGDPDEASDLVQETFMNAYRGWDSFEGRSDPRTWIYRIATRACRRMHRKRSGEPDHMLSFDELLPSAEEGVVDLTRRGDTLAALQRREADEIVDRALRKIPEPFRIVLILREIMDLSLSEVAAILDIKKATARTRLHRARLYLRKALTDSLPRKDAPHPDHPREVCLNLLQAKQEALDRRVPFNVPDADLCERCRVLFSTLDLAKDACVSIQSGNLPDELRRLLVRHFNGSDGTWL